MANQLVDINQAAEISVSASVDQLESKTDAVKTAVDAVTTAVGVGNTDLGRLASCHPQNVTKATVDSSADDYALLKAGKSYLILVQPDVTDLSTATGVYWSLKVTALGTFDTNVADTDSPVWLSSWGPLVITPDSEATLSMLRIGSADVTVQVIGLTATSTTAIS